MSYIELSNAHLTRQLDVIPVEVLGEKITIIGAGAVGSFTALALAKMGFANITVFDFDSIEIENMNCQFYPYNTIGMPKVMALQAMIKSFANVDIEAKLEKYTQGVFPGVVISAVDSMAVRNTIWENHKEKSPATKLIIDPRMSAEFATCYAMNPMSSKDISSYEKTLFSDSEAVQERCTAKSTMFCVLALSSHVVKVVKDFTTNSTPYTRVMHWNIKENKQECYPHKKEPLV